MPQSSSVKQFWKGAVALALPIALQNLLISCAALIDTAMITPLGDAELAAVGVAGRFAFLLNVLAFGFCSGASALISQFWGCNDRNNIHRTYGFALSTSMAFAVVLTVIFRLFPAFCIGIFGPKPDVALLAQEYLSIYAFAVPFVMYSQVTCAALRATEKVSVPLVSSLASVAVNTFLNYSLIWGRFGMPALRVRGAAIATVSGFAVQAVMVFCFLTFGKNAVHSSVRQALNFDGAFAVKFIKTAAPVLLNEAMWAVGTNIYVMVLVRQGTEQYAGYSVYETVQQLFFVFFVGIAHASSILVGKAVGRGDRREAYVTARRFLIATPLFGLVLGLILIGVRHLILPLLNIQSDLAYDTAASLLLFYGLWIGMRMIPYTCICGIFRAGGDTRTGCYFELGSIYLVSIPAVCCAGLLLHLPFVAIVAIMFMAEDIPKGILCIRHFKKKKWIRQLTDAPVQDEEILG